MRPSAAGPFLGCFIIGTSTLLSVVTDSNNATRDSSYGQQLANDIVTRRSTSVVFAMRNRAMSFRCTFNKYLAYHLRNYPVGFILYEEDTERHSRAVFRATTSRGRPGYTAWLGRREFPRQKINIQRAA